MSPAAHLWLWFLLVFGIVVLPGVDMAYVAASSLVGGRRAGLAAIAGIVTGGACHFVMAATGVAVVLRVVPAAFNALLFAGTAYLAWIGIGILRSASVSGPLEAGPRRTLAATFRGGALTNLLNPKAYLFMLAVFPQFVRPGAWPVAGQAAVLWVVCALTQGAVYGAVALAADRARTWRETHARADVLLARVVGASLLAVAIAGAVEGWRRG